MRTLSETFKALGDETRLRILAVILLRGEACVCDIEAILGITQSKASRHMRYLRGAGLVVDRRHGVWLHYRLDPDLDPARRGLIERLPALLGEVAMADLRGRLDGWLEMKACQDDCCGAGDPPRDLAG